MIIFRFIALLLFSTSLALSVPVFKQNDRVVFIGDSITHGGRYHADVYLFYATRFPHEPFNSYNCGISGDTAFGTNHRFASDISRRRPNIAAIMLGMNDAISSNFESSLPLQKRIKAQANAYKTYTTAMDQLAASLTAIDCDIIFIKPSIYDQTAKLDKTNLIGKNDQIGRFARFLETLALKYESSVVDFYTPMGVINHTLQASKPQDSIIGKDRVHPGIPGHLVMAYHFLKAQNMSPYISAIRLDAQAIAKGTGKIIEQLNCEIHGDLKFSKNAMNFTATEQALPFPLNQAQMKALEWVPFQHELNRQVLAIDNLIPGDYTLTIDGIKVGEYTSEKLKAGIDLSANKATPQYKQALRVKAHQDKQLKATSMLRLIAHVRHTMLRNVKPIVDDKNNTELSKTLHAYLEKHKGKPWYGYFKDQADRFIDAVPQEAKFKEEEDFWMQEMWKENQPIPHSWQLEKIDA